MSYAYIVSPLRTPIGKFGGGLAPLKADALAAHIIRAVLDSSGFPQDRIDEVIVSQSYQSSEAPCIGRYAAGVAGLPDEVSGYTVDRRCGSGLQAVIDAAMQVQTGSQMTLARAEALKDQGRMDEAIVRYREFAASDPDSFDGQRKLGAALLEAGRVSEAMPQRRAPAYVHGGVGTS